MSQDAAKIPKIDFSAYDKADAEAARLAPAFAIKRAAEQAAKTHDWAAMGENGTVKLDLASTGFTIRMTKEGRARMVDIRDDGDRAAYKLQHLYGDLWKGEGNIDDLLPNANVAAPVSRPEPAAKAVEQPKAGAAFKIGPKDLAYSTYPTGKRWAFEVEGREGPRSYASKAGAEGAALFEIGKTGRRAAERPESPEREAAAEIAAYAAMEKDHAAKLDDKADVAAERSGGEFAEQIEAADRQSKPFFVKPKAAEPTVAKVEPVRAVEPPPPAMKASTRPIEASAAPEPPKAEIEDTVRFVFDHRRQPEAAPEPEADIDSEAALEMRGFEQWAAKNPDMRDAALASLKAAVSPEAPKQEAARAVDPARRGRVMPGGSVSAAKVADKPAEAATATAEAATTANPSRPKRIQPGSSPFPSPEALTAAKTTDGPAEGVKPPTR